VKTSIFDENVVRANRSYNDEHGQEAEAPRKNTVEIDNSRSDGLLEMRAASPKSLIGKTILRRISLQLVASFLWRAEEDGR
jgi:hypothetical protein